MSQEKVRLRLALDLSVNYIEVSYKDQSLKFIVTLHGTISQQLSAEDIFRHINQYMASLPNETNRLIFEEYKKAIGVFEQFYLAGKINHEITNIVQALLTYLDYHKLRNWICIGSDILIPDSFKDSFEEDIDNNITRDKTYIRNDIIELYVMTLLTKALFPLIGYYISINKKDVGNLMKEMFVMNILVSTDYVNLPAYHKLEEYVNAIIDVTKEQDSKSMILKGLSSDDQSYWLLSNIIVNKLPYCNINDESNNIVSIIYRTIVQRITNNARPSKGSIKDKLIDDADQDTDSKISVLERYKIKSTFSIGEIVELEYILSDPYHVAQRLSSRIDLESLDESLFRAQKLLDKNISSYQIQMLRWITKPVVSPYALDYFTKQTIVNMIGVAHEVLFQHDHQYLALWLMSECLDSESGDSIFITNLDTKQRISAVLQEEIFKLYPYQKEYIAQKEDAKRHPVIKTIDNFVNEMRSKGWVMLAREERVTQTLGNYTTLFDIQPDIRNQLARLICDVGARRIF